jgi:hypothetical protein
MSLEGSRVRALTEAINMLVAESESKAAKELVAAA